MDRSFLETTSSLFEDENSVIRLPLNPIDYTDHNHIERLCYICGQLFPQGKMKEMEAFDEEVEERVYSDNDHWFRNSKAVFYCIGCWYTSDISDASNWTA